MSIRDTVDNHKKSKTKFVDKIHSLMSENFDNALHQIVKQTLEQGKRGFAVAIEREQGNQNDPDNPHLVIDNSDIHIQRLNQNANPENFIPEITTKTEIIEIKRILLESGILVEEYFAHISGDANSGMFQRIVGDDEWGGYDWEYVPVSDTVFNNYWKSGIELYYCGRGEISLEKKFELRFEKGGLNAYSSNYDEDGPQINLAWCWDEVEPIAKFGEEQNPPSAYYLERACYTFLICTL